MWCLCMDLMGQVSPLLALSTTALLQTLNENWEASGQGAGYLFVACRRVSRIGVPELR